MLDLPHSIRRLRRHDFIVRQDETPHVCCVLLSGYAIRHKTAGNGGRQVFSLHLPGDAVDLHNSLLGVADHNVETLTNAEVATIGIDALRTLTMARPALGQAMWLETLLDSAILREWTLNIARRDARSRTAHMICELTLRLEEAGLGSATRFEMPMTHEELADALALTSIHVSRTLKALVDEGLIARHNRSIEVLDWRQLAKLGDFSRDYLHLPPTQ